MQPKFGLQYSVHKILLRSLEALPAFRAPAWGGAAAFRCPARAARSTAAGARPVLTRHAARGRYEIASRADGKSQLDIATF